MMRGQPHYFNPTPILPRLIRWCYGLLFVGILLAGAYYTLVYAHSVRENGSLEPTVTHTVLQHEDGETVYITHRQALVLNLLGAAFALSLLGWLMLGLLLEFKLKIHLFRGSPAPLPPEPKKDGPPTSFSQN